MYNCFKFIYFCISHNWSTLTHPFSLFPSKLLLPLWRHATLTLKKSADPWLFCAFVSVPSPVFYERLLEYEAEEAFLTSERQGWGSTFSENIMLLCPNFPLYPVFCAAHLSSLPSCWTSLCIFLFVMRCFTSPGKIGMLELRVCLCKWCVLAD